MALYLTADGKDVIAGNLYDAQGNDLSTAPLEKLVYAPMARKSGPRWKTAAGSRTAIKRPAHRLPVQRPQLPVLQHVLGTGPPVGQGRQVQLRHIMVGIIREDSPGKSAALLAAKDPQKPCKNTKPPARQQAQGAGKIPAEVEAKLDANMKLMDELELSATPAIFYLDDKGGLQQQQGRRRRISW